MQFHAISIFTSFWYCLSPIPPFLVTVKLKTILVHFGCTVFIAQLAAPPVSISLNSQCVPFNSRLQDWSHTGPRALPSVPSRAAPIHSSSLQFAEKGARAARLPHRQSGSLSPAFTQTKQRNISSLSKQRGMQTQTYASYAFI